ncbi:Protein ALP1-like [Glycine soja]
MEKRPWPETRHATVMETTDATMAGDETVFGDPTMCFIVDANEGDERCYHGQRIHPPVRKFNGCYKQADKHRRNGSSEKDVLADAHMIYSQDTVFKKNKGSTSGNYSSSSNPETPIEVEEYDTLSPMSRPIGPKAAKRKSKGKECPNTLDLSGIESVMKDKNMNTLKLIQLKEAREKRLQEQEQRMEYEILMKDTSNMFEQQRKDHENYHIMDPTIDLDEVLDQMIDEELEDNNDEEIIRFILESQQQLHGNTTSRSQRRKVVHRNREEGHHRLFNEYFSENPVYTEIQFRRRFCMQRHVLIRIVNALSNHDEYFQMRVDALRQKGLSPLQKCTTAIHILAYGSHADSVDEYVRIGETTTVECLERFVLGICTIFGNEYLRRPNNEDIERLLQMGAACGFPGDHRNPTIILEAVASKDLWIWHAFFGTAGSNNDIIVLNGSNVFDEVLSGHAPAVQFMVNRTQYNMGYYLADDIYPDFVTPSQCHKEKKKLFAQRQESVRKDVERAFGVLQSRFAIIRGPSRFWDAGKMKNIIYACIILHNMIVEDERNNTSTFEVSLGAHPNIRSTYLQRRAQLHDKQKHSQLQADLVEHI